MPFCPKCRQEYRDGFTTCTDCNEVLVDHPPQAPVPEAPSGAAISDPVLLITASDLMEATWLETQLTGAGIPILKKHRGSGLHMEIMMGVTSYGVDFYVPSAALEDARRIIEPPSSSEDARWDTGEITVEPEDFPLPEEDGDSQELPEWRSREHTARTGLGLVAAISIGLVILAVVTLVAYFFL